MLNVSIILAALLAVFIALSIALAITVLHNPQSVIPRFLPARRFHYSQYHRRDTP